MRTDTPWKGEQRARDGAGQVYLGEGGLQRRGWRLGEREHTFLRRSDLGQLSRRSSSHWFRNAVRAGASGDRK